MERLRQRVAAWRVSVIAVARVLPKQWREDRAGGLAAEIAFFGFLSLMPTLLAVAGALGSIEAVVGGDVAADAKQAVLDYLAQVLSSEASGVIDAVRSLFERSNAGAFTIGFVTAVWAASRAFLAVLQALDVAYGVAERRRYVALRVRALALALGSLVFGALLLAMVVLGPLLGTGRRVAETVGLGSSFAFFWDALRWPVAAAASVLWAATLFHFAPDHRTPWRADLAGALLTAALWTAASVGLRVYLDFAGGVNPVLGSLGGSLIVMLWMYLMSAALVVGGELNSIRAARR